MMNRVAFLVVGIGLCCAGCTKPARPTTDAEAASPPTQLTVRQTPPNREAIEEPQNEDHARSSSQIMIDARVIAGDAALAALAVTDGAWQGAGDVQRWSAALDPETAAALLVTAQVAEGSTVMTAPHLTVADGQRTVTAVASETAYTAGFRRGADGPDGVEFEPVSDLVIAGVTLDVQAVVSADRTSVSLHLRPTVTQLEEMEDAAWPNAPPGREDLRIQVPHTITATVDDTVNVPNDASVLLRVARTRKPFDRDAPPLEPLYMLFRATILSPTSARGG